MTLNVYPNLNFRKKYNEESDSRDWTYENAKKTAPEASIEIVDYRPFDRRYVPYSPKSKGILSYPRNEIMKQMLGKDNVALLVCKQQSTFDFQHVFISQSLTDKCTVSSQTKEASYQFPLYLYPNDNAQQTLDGRTERVPNLNSEIVDKIAAAIDETFTNEEEDNNGTFAPIDILDYIYAVLHSPSYREKYKEFLKIDFPRVPYPKSADSFWDLADLGGQLRRIHLLESVYAMDFITIFNVSGDNVVEKPEYRNGNVYLNSTQCFEDVPEIAWNFYIGGYQPAQKWLKDRKGRTLNYDDIQHYQKMIVALTETDRLMKEIDQL